MKHSPGPWIVRLMGSWYQIVHGNPLKYRVIAELPSLPGLEAKPEDADLIAAAPDLLEAAKNAVEIFRATGDCGKITTDLEKAIAKAEATKRRFNG